MKKRQAYVVIVRNFWELNIPDTTATGASLKP